MEIFESILQNKQPNFERLTAYGFKKQGSYYIYSTAIMDGAFCLSIYITENGALTFRVADKATAEEYVLVQNPHAVGAFVGTVRAQCEAILNDILDKCYVPNVFKSASTKQVLRYVREKYDTEAEYLWETSPNNAALREKNTKKWYAALLTVEKRKIGIPKDGVVEIIDLKAPPEEIEGLVDGKTYFPGYHMNKKHWYTVCLDGSVPMETVCECIDKSYNLVSRPAARKKAK